jgi:hypothetical protein
MCFLKRGRRPAITTFKLIDEGRFLKVVSHRPDGSTKTVHLDREFRQHIASILRHRD